MTLSEADYVSTLRTMLGLHADAAQALGMKAYMRNQFEFLGISTPTRQALTREFFLEHGGPDASQLAQVVRPLWDLPEREYQYSALTLLGFASHRLSVEHMPLLEDLITRKSWWDTVDSLAVNLVGPVVLRQAGQASDYADKWLRSENMWLQRTAILFQLKWKQQTDEPLLFSCIERSLQSPEFFIRKAIGWALREYSKTAPARVETFVSTHAASLSPLSAREALRWIRKQS